MKLKIKRKYFEQCPVKGYLVGGLGDDIIYEVSDNFVRDLNIELSSGDKTNYTTMLVRLIFKASGSNWDKLTTIYPAECLTIWAYQNITEFHKQLV